MYRCRTRIVVLRSTKSKGDGMRDATLNFECDSAKAAYAMDAAGSSSGNGYRI
jgi:hypothetical protein